MIKRKAGVNVKISEVFRKRALFGVVVFCITAIATVGTLSVRVDEEDNTPNNLVDLNTTDDSEDTQMADGGQTMNKAEISGIQVGGNTENADTPTGDIAENIGVHWYPAGYGENNTKRIFIA